MINSITFCLHFVYFPFFDKQLNNPCVWPFWQDINHSFKLYNYITWPKAFIMLIIHSIQRFQNFDLDKGYEMFGVVVWYVPCIGGAHYNNIKNRLLIFLNQIWVVVVRSVQIPASWHQGVSIGSRGVQSCFWRTSVLSFSLDPTQFCLGLEQTQDFCAAYWPSRTGVSNPVPGYLPTCRLQDAIPCNLLNLAFIHCLIQISSHTTASGQSDQLYCWILSDPNKGVNKVTLLV